MSDQDSVFSSRRLPVRPNLDQLKHQAKDWLRAIRNGDPQAIAEFNHYVPRPSGADIKLSDVQHALALSYQAPNWARLVQACELVDAIWRDDENVVRELVSKNPNLLHEHATIRDSNWGPPLSYAANLGRDRIIKLLHSLGATDLKHAIGRAVLQSKIGTARMIYRLLGSPPVPEDALGGPAYTLSVSGTAAVLEFGGQVIDANGIKYTVTNIQEDPAAQYAVKRDSNGVRLPVVFIAGDCIGGRVELVNAATSGELKKKVFG